MNNGKRTKLYNCHIQNSAKLVNFAGFEMPMQYTSIIAEHKLVRESVGIFDVSHMGEIFIKGKKALEHVQTITVNDASRLEIGKVQYSAMCYENGGIVDDLLVYKLTENEYMLVVNGANKDKDFEWIVKNNMFGTDVIDQSENYSLIAVQGPNSQKVLEKLLARSIEIDFYTFFVYDSFKTDIIVSRTGYTGELGYELYFKGDPEEAEQIWNDLLQAGKEFNIAPVGLGCRDSLRLEMGYCLYGNDIDETTSTLEAGLGWITKLKKGDFIGREILIDQKENGIKRKLVPLIIEGRAIPRKDYIITKNGRSIGKITSGTMSPMLNQPIALGYVEIENAKIDDEVEVTIRNKSFNAKITKLPFVNK